LRQWVVLALALFVLAHLAVPIYSADWPHWRGPNRDGTTPEDSGFSTGAWPPKAPLWAKRLKGTGETSPIVAGGRLYTMAYGQGQDRVYCLHAVTGQEIWQRSYPCRERGRHAVGDQTLYQVGPLATPEHDAGTGYLYTLGADGDLNCWDTRRSGARVWGVNLYDRFGAGRRPATSGCRRDYGFITSPLVQGAWVIVQVGAKDGNLMAFDKLTGGSPVGTPVWRSANVDPAGHAGGMVPMVVEGIPCVASFTLHRLLVVRVDPKHEGETVATYPFEPACGSTIVTPTVWGDKVGLSTHQAPADDLVKVTLKGATRVGEYPHSEVGVPVQSGSRVYKGSGVLECWTLAGGRANKAWEGEVLGDEGSVILTADRKLIALGQSRLLLYTTEGKELARSGGLHTGWQQPVLSDGLLYVKDGVGNLECYRLRAAGPSGTVSKTAAR
jgi:hypothetical protein